MSSKVRALANGTVLNTICFALTSVISLVLMPYILHSLGDRDYGFWVLVGSVIGYYWIADFGIGSAVERYISREVDSKDEGRDERINAVFNNGFFIFSGAGLFLLLISFVICLALPLFLKNPNDLHVFRIAFVLLGLDFALGFPLRAFSGLLRAFLKFNTLAVIQIVMLLVRTGAIVYVLSRGWGLIGLAAVTTANDLLARLAGAFFAWRTFPHMRLRLRAVSLGQAKELYSFGWYSLVMQVAGQFRTNMDNFVIAFYFGSALVTPFSIASRLIDYYKQFISSIFEMTMPYFSQIEQHQDDHGLHGKLDVLLRINVYMAFYIAGILICLGRAFIRRWMGPEYDHSYFILIVLALSCFLFVAQRSTYEFLRGTSRHKFCAWLDVSEGVSNLILSLILAPMFGLMGVAWGTLIPVLVAQVFILPNYLHRKIGIPRSVYYLRFFGALARGIILTALAWGVISMFLKPSYPMLILAAAVQSLIYWAGILVIGMSQEERSAALAMIRRRRTSPPPDTALIADESEV